jgi:hypothetical protein
MTGEAGYPRGVGLFRRRQIKPGDDLANISTELLLEEYVKHADALAKLNAINQMTEFATKDNPAVVDADFAMGALHGVVIRDAVRKELERRGVTPPDE